MEEELRAAAFDALLMLELGQAEVDTFSLMVSAAAALQTGNRIGREKSGVMLQSMGFLC